MGSVVAELRATNINLRANLRQKALIDSAAEAVGRNRTDFMLDAACRAAESVLLDRCYFRLGEKEFRRFNDMLDNPPESNPKLANLLARKPLWEE